MQEVTNEQHSDFIWTWKSNAKGRRVSLWIPYLKQISKLKGRGKWKIEFKGGDLEINLANIDFIMLYGCSGNLPVEFLDSVCAYHITLMIHRRNMQYPAIMYSSPHTDDQDVLTQQILYRQNSIKCTYIARILIRERLDRFKYAVTFADVGKERLQKARTVETVRAIEAEITAKFWKEWFTSLKHPDWTRRGKNHISAALDACSFFMYGILLRWILFHKLSPCHAYLHQPSSYPSLPYDLMEPYRYIIESAVAFTAEQGIEEDSFTAFALENLKDLLNEVVYVPATRQFLRRKNLLHGIVLALRSYLLGESKNFIPPVEGKKKGGRPPQVGYKLPGEVPEPITPLGKYI